MEESVTNFIPYVVMSTTVTDDFESSYKTINGNRTLSELRSQLS